MIRGIFFSILFSTIIFITGFSGYFGVNTILPALVGTDISLIDIVFRSDSIPQEKVNLIHERVVTKSSQLGKQAASKFNNILPKSNTSKVYVDIPYAYPDAMATVENNWKLSDESLKVTLQQMSEWDQTTLADVRKQSLETMPK